jgi:hypothetical protein
MLLPVVFHRRQSGKGCRRTGRRLPGGDPVSNEDFVACVRDLTSGDGVNVVYDSVGKDTF